MKKLIKYIGVLGISGILFLSGFFTHVYLVNQTKPFTSDQLLEAVNQYRQTNNLQPLLLSEPLCNDLVSRWDNYIKNQNHEGLQDWVKRTGVYEKGFTDGHENIVTANTLQKAMDWWINSEGHRLALLDSNSDSACVYVKDNTAVLMMADNTKN